MSAARVTSVRQVRWDGFRPNFFIVFSPGVLEKVTGTLIVNERGGGWSREFQRELFERGHAAAVLPYDPERDRVLLAEA